MEMLSELRKARRGAIAKTITIMENDSAGARRILREIFPHTGNSMIIGITGPAGAGKSTLIDKTAVAMRKLGIKPAVLAVDPTSHITGGAALGDRSRMSRATDSGIYIRSIASRGATGAVSHSLRNIVRVLEYAGFDPIMIESVGAGQTEIEISRIADITVVVFNPNTGDSIQAIKAGLTEIGDIYLVNKSDLDGANQLYDALMEQIGTSEDGPLVLKTSAARNSGISALAKTLKAIMIQKRPAKPGTDGARLERELRDIVLNASRQRLDELLGTDRTFRRYLKRLQARQIDPYDAADKIIKRLEK